MEIELVEEKIAQEEELFALLATDMDNVFTINEEGFWPDEETPF